MKIKLKNLIIGSTVLIANYKGSGDIKKEDILYLGKPIKRTVTIPDTNEPIIVRARLQHPKLGFFVPFEEVYIKPKPTIYLFQTPDYRTEKPPVNVKEAANLLKISVIEYFRRLLFAIKNES